MNLSQKIRDVQKLYRINNFKRGYPEVYKWFQSEEFSDLFFNKVSVSLRRHFLIEGSFSPQVYEGYPWKDSDGVVDLDDIVEYLEAEGFHVNIEEVRVGFTKIDELTITL